VPSHARDSAYAERLRRAYPVHPELFDILYQAWSTLERFQRTRGVLRLMALVVAALWHRDDRSPLILPGSVPLDEITVGTEFLRYLEDSWDTILDEEVDSSDQRALAVRLDAEDPSRLGAVRAARKLARTMFLATAPLLNTQHHGVDAERVYLGVLAPGEQPTIYQDALVRLAERATYLYSDQERYWFALQPSIRRRAQELRARFREDAERLEHAIVEGLRGEVGRGPFEGVHIAPTHPGDVPDEPRLRLVVLGPESQSAEEASSRYEELAERIVRECNEGVARRFRNVLLFLVPQLRGLSGRREAAADVLAWRQLGDDLGNGRIELTSQQQRILR